MASTITAAAVIFLVLAAWVAIERVGRAGGADRSGECRTPESAGQCQQCGLEDTCGPAQASLSEDTIEVPGKTAN